MPTQSLVSVSEYLGAAYEPDCDYLDGVLEERNVGEKDHSRLQTTLGAIFHNRRREWNCHPYVEMRLQVSATRFRIPDVCVVLGAEPEEQIFTRPPFLCIEVVSPEDRVSRMQARIEDYLAFGVAYVWVIDPQTRKAEVHTAAGSRRVLDGLLRTQSPEIIVPLADLFEA